MMHVLVKAILICDIKIGGMYPPSLSLAEGYESFEKREIFSSDESMQVLWKEVWY